MNHVEPWAAEILESRTLLSATLSVDPRFATTDATHFHTIQAAVNSASAGATILVAPATYLEDVTVSKSLTLLGGQILGPGESGPSTVEYMSTGFTVSSANNVTIKGFTIEPAPNAVGFHAILATNSAHSKFDNNVMANPNVADGDDIELNGGVRYTEVANNSDATDSALFILVAGSTSSNAHDTFLDNTCTTLAFDASATGADVAGNTAGSFKNESNNVSFIDNTANATFGQYGFLGVGNNNTFIGNTADDHFGGFMIAGSGLTFVGNVANHDGRGMIINGPAASVRFNTANNNDVCGFQIVGRSATLIDNTADHNRDGIEINGNSARLIGNTANNNLLTGIQLLGVTHNALFDNAADNNGSDGIHLFGAAHNTFTGDVADNNGSDGIEVDSGSTGNTFSINTALGNTNFDLADASMGTGTANTANTWIDNVANTANPTGIR